jgi:hypothetical protein
VLALLLLLPEEIATELQLSDAVINFRKHLKTILFSTAF